MKIAIQGELGSFSHEAARSMSSEVEVVPKNLSAAVFASLADGEVDAIVIPIENSIAGPVAEHYDLLLSHQVAIEREVLLHITHNLIARPGSSLEQIRKALSHPIALAQCRQFFQRNRQIEPTPFYDTAGAVKHVLSSGGAADEAGIASLAAAEYYGGEVLARAIQDNPENYTRFFLVRRTEDIPAALGVVTKSSIAFSTENKPGALVRALDALARCGTNLSKIESRPVPGSPWHYVFYADCQVSDSQHADQALSALRGVTTMVRELGRYSEASRPR